ncbi:Coiled-coil domain-containing protein 146 [Channa argus]|uniref:Coiled-coil domain-containing protein 146 n=1 Tax=Channa argus TaxID=215402 RepID=A0A6G1QQU9_CHAAH|nr:Coiled-coil domain-containing protein 146 [Channa argus]
MSLSEDQQHSRPPSREEEMEEKADGENGIGQYTPLVALAPDVSLPEEQPPAFRDITTSPAFLCLDELFTSGIISQTKVDKLKSSYRLLYDTLKSAQDSEINLLEEAKRCHAELEKLQAEVEKAEGQSTSEEPESEVNKLSQQLLQAYNELKAAEDREYKTQHQLKCLWEEKHYLEKENETQPKPAELESRMKDLQDKYEDLRKEVAQRQLEVRSLTEDVETHEMQILKEQKELEDQKEIIKLKEAERAHLISIPDQILKEIERKRSKKEAAMRKIETLNTEISEMEQQVKEVEECNLSFSMKKKEAKQELEGLRAQIEVRQKQYKQLVKEQEVNREQEAEFKGNRGILEMKLQNIMLDRKHLYESHSIQLREKNRQMQALKRMEHKLAMAVEQLGLTQSIYNELHAKLDAIPKREASVQQRMELHKEVDVLKVSFEKQLLVAEEESQKKQQYGIIEELLKESNHLREELHNLRCLTKIKAEERGQKHRELLRAEQLKQQIEYELREKDLIIMDHNKLNTMLQRRLLQYCKLCNMIMDEKKKYVKLKEISSEMITELREQLKVLENEKEIQRTIVINKDSGIQLLEHEEVLFNYYEKVNIQEAANIKGSMALETLEKEISNLKLAINEEKRKIDVKKKELSVARDKTLEVLNQQADYNELKGTDPSAVELVKKIEQLEVNLAERERQLLEKDLLVDQVTRLSKPLSERAENGQQDRLTLAKKLNHLRILIINTNHKLMAVSAELSMKQAAALSLQQEIKEKELQMDRCQRQLEEGLPPCPEIEEEWKRMLRDKKRRQRDKEERERFYLRGKIFVATVNGVTIIEALQLSFALICTAGVIGAR